MGPEGEDSRVLLVFPPGWTPFSPYLALPCLKAYLEGIGGIRTEIRDLNLLFFDYIFSSDILRHSLDRCRQYLDAYNKMVTLSLEQQEHFRSVTRALLFGDSLNRISDAKNVFRTSKFYEQESYNRARQTFFECLHIVSAQFKGAKVRFDAIELKASQSSDFSDSAFGDPSENIFLTFFEDAFIPSIKTRELDVFGISITSASQLFPALCLAKIVKRNCRNIKHITLGGNYITRILSRDKELEAVFRHADSVIMFEGEAALLNLAKSIVTGNSLAEVPNLVFRNGSGFCRNASVTTPIHVLPPPDFSGFPLDAYFMPELILPLYSSRSCFGKCTFCSIPFASDGGFRSISADKLYCNMNALAKRHNVRHFDIVDETFSPTMMRRLAQRISREGNNFLWFAETRFSPKFTKEFCADLYKGGCRKIQFGLESYNQRILDLMKKEVLVEWIEPALKSCMHANIAVHLFFMVGFPGETREEALETISFTRRMIDMARLEFGNPHWTRGWGSFSLDRHAAVYRDAESFGVTLDRQFLDGPGNSTKLAGFAFQSASGLTQLEAEEIVRSSKNDITRLLRDAGRYQFHLQNLNLNSEEESFLRICWNEQHSHVPARFISKYSAILTVEISHPFLSLPSHRRKYAHYDSINGIVWESDMANPSVCPASAEDWIVIKVSDEEAYAYETSRGRKILLNGISALFVEHLVASGIDEAIRHVREIYPNATSDTISKLVRSSSGLGIYRPKVHRKVEVKQLDETI